jgi:hypothetical protein
MATIVFHSYTARMSGPFVQIDLGLGSEPPFASRQIVAKNVAEITTAFEAYKADAAATGLAMALSIRLKDGRKPNGFDALKAATRTVTVNL